MRRLQGVIVVLVLAMAAGYGQTFRGAINGTVTDPSGAVVPSATVKATNLGTGTSYSMATTTDGQFAFQDLPLGTYKVSVSAKGFRDVAVDKVAVTAGSVYTLPLKLAVGQEATTVEVSAAALTVDTTTMTQTDTIPDTALQNVPLNGRDFSQLIAVAPGYGGYSLNGFGSLNGTRANQMNWQIDGTDNNDFWHNIPAVNQGGVSGIAGVLLPIDAIDEFSAQTQSNAETGRNAGGTINLVLKSGTNSLHGSAYYYNRNEFYAASSPFAPSGTKPPALRDQNYGGTVGGPIVKDKTFYFLGFERQNYIVGLSGVATEPSLQWQALATDLINNPGNKYGTYPTPVSLSPVSQNLISTLWPGYINNLSATINNFFSPVTSTGYSNNWIIKLDHNFNTKNHLSARWFTGQGSQTQPLGSSPALATASSNLGYYFETAPIRVQNYSLVLNSVLTSRTTNQVLFGVNIFHQNFHDAKNDFNTRALGLFLSPDATINGQPILGAPNIAISGFEQVGITPPEGRNDPTGHLTDIVSHTVGKHQFRFGGETRHGRVEEFYYRHSLGSFTFDGSQGPWNGPQSCGSVAAPPACASLNKNIEALADFLSGNVQSSSIAVGHAERHVSVNAFNLFLEDAWQLTRKLNLNLGLRYEYFGPPHNDTKDLVVFIPSKGGNVIQGAGIDSIFPPDKNNLAPRFGFAYQPKENGNTVVRGGFGVFFDQINMNPFFDFRPPAGAADGLEDNPAGPSPVDKYNTNRLGKGSYLWEDVLAGGNPIFAGATTCVTGNAATDPNCGTHTYNVYSVNQNFRTSYFYNYNLQVERSFGNAAVLQVGYVGSAGRKLQLTQDLNQNNAYGPCISSPTTCQFPNIGSILQLTTEGTSNYNALQSVFKVRSWYGLTSQFAYTWSHALDQVSEYRGVKAPLNLDDFYGNGDYDTRHNFTTYVTYDIPGSSHGPKILTHGWQLNSLLSFHSGQPFDEVRPGSNLIGDPFAGISHRFNKAGVTWINTAAFCTPSLTCLPNNPIGDVRRNQYYGPGFADVDLSVFKNIPITERLKMQLRAEMYNLFNRINLVSGPGSVGSNGLVSDTIGDANGAPGIGPGEPFNMQLAIKIIF
ncbi:MAG: TonB-dependent receptor [Acidobacteria bacterium]|nr:MAG: TonB-dependent receptor [Acidobacteriota bacterium]PYY09129.1 MAG: TonB-dependent receptor [Acidobacteriota bacterium]